jgi:hypothetical protein
VQVENLRYSRLQVCVTRAKLKPGAQHPWRRFVTCSTAHLEPALWRRLAACCVADLESAFGHLVTGWCSLV